MKIEAGWKLWYRKPKAAPAVIAASTPAPVQLVDPSRHAWSSDSAITDRVAAAIVQTPAANPWTPSVKFSIFITATMPTTVIGPIAPATPTWPRNGRVNASTFTPARTGMSAAPTWPSSFPNRGRSQMSSATPTSVITNAPTAIPRICLFTSRSPNSGRNSRPATATPARIASPPRLGVGSSPRPRSRGMSMAPMLRASRAASGAVAKAMTAATRKPQRASMWLIGRSAYPGPPMRIWIDMTASAHPLVFRPIIARLREQSHEVEVTARDYAQTLELLDMLGIDHISFGRHGGESRVGKVAALFTRARQMRKFAKGKHFDLAACHGSNDPPIAARRLGIPAVDMFDYEFATYQHNVGCRLASRVMTPDSIPPQRLRRFGVDDMKLAQYPGLKEEYYLADFEANPAVLEQLGLDTAKVLVVLRPPPDVSLYHRKSNPLFPQVVRHLGTHEDVQAVVLPRTTAQKQYVRSLELPSLVVPDHAVDAQSLISYSDLVVSAGGTMNREAVALGTPVYTTYGGRLGGVDETLIRQGKLRPLTDPRALDLAKRDGAGERMKRDPDVLVDMFLGTLGR